MRAFQAGSFQMIGLLGGPTFGRNVHPAKIQQPNFSSPTGSQSRPYLFARLERSVLCHSVRRLAASTRAVVQAQIDHASHLFSSFRRWSVVAPCFHALKVASSTSLLGFKADGPDWRDSAVPWHRH